MISPALPAGAIRRYGEASLPIASEFPTSPPDGKTIAYGWNWRLCLMDAATRHKVTTNELTSPIKGLCYGRDGALFTELADGTVIEWSLVPPGPKPSE